MTSRNFARVGGIALTTALLAGVAAPAMAGSFYVQEQSTRGQGRANAGVGGDVVMGRTDAAGGEDIVPA